MSENDLKEQFPERYIQYSKQKVIGDASDALQPSKILQCTTRDMKSFGKDLEEKRVPIEVNVQRRISARTCDDAMAAFKSEGQKQWLDTFSYATDRDSVDGPIRWSVESGHFCRCWPSADEEADASKVWTDEETKALGPLEAAIKEKQVAETQHFPELYYKAFSCPSFFRFAQTEVQVCVDISTLIYNNFEKDEVQKAMHQSMLGNGKKAVSLVLTLAKALMTLYSSTALPADFHAAYRAVFPTGGEAYRDPIFEDVSEAFRQRPEFKERDRELLKSASNEVEHGVEYETLLRDVAAAEPLMEPGITVCKDAMLRWTSWHGALKQESLDGLAQAIANYIYKCHRKLLEVPESEDQVPQWQALSDIATPFQSHPHVGGKMRVVISTALGRTRNAASLKHVEYIQQTFKVKREIQPGEREDAKKASITDRTLEAIKGIPLGSTQAKQCVPNLKIAQVYTRFCLLENIENGAHESKSMQILDAICAIGVESDFRHKELLSVQSMRKDILANHDKCIEKADPAVGLVRNLQHALEKFHTRIEAAKQKQKNDTFVELYANAVNPGAPSYAPHIPRAFYPRL